MKKIIKKCIATLATMSALIGVATLSSFAYSDNTHYGTYSKTFIRNCQNSSSTSNITLYANTRPNSTNCDARVTFEYSNGTITNEKNFTHYVHLSDLTCTISPESYRYVWVAPSLDQHWVEGYIWIAY